MERKRISIFTLKTLCALLLILVIGALTQSAYPIMTVEAAAGQQQFTDTACTSASPCTFTVPTYTRRLTVEVWGAGAGGGGGGNPTATDGGPGGSTAFGTGSATTTANGGSGGQEGIDGGTGGAGGTACSAGPACNGDVITAGTAGATASGLDGGDGGNPAQRGGTGNTGGGVGPGGIPGGGGSGGSCNPDYTGGGGGGGGAYSRKTYAVGDLTVGATMYAVVGTGGTAGASGLCSGGGAGARGEVRVTWDSVLITSASTVTGSLNTTDSISKSSGSFVIDHPLMPRTHLLFHSFVESPDVKNVYDGIAILDENGEATILLPDYMMSLNTDFRYLATGIESSMPNLHLKRGVRREFLVGALSFRVAGGEPGGTISWQVTGVRRDPYILANPIDVEVNKDSSTIVGPNTCIFQPLCQ